MKDGTRKFLVSEFVLLMAFSVVVAPVLTVEKVYAQEGGSWTTLAPLLIMLVVVIVAAVLYKKRLTKNRQSSVHIRSLITEYC
jgi:hypothetical protein